MGLSDIDISNALLEEQNAYEAREEAQRDWIAKPSHKTSSMLAVADEALRSAESNLLTITEADLKGGSSS